MTPINQTNQDEPQLNIKPSFWQESWIMTVAIILLIIAGSFWLYSYMQAKKMTAQYLATAEAISINKSQSLNNNNNMENNETTTPTVQSGLQIEVLQEGNGTALTKAGDNISVHYTGTLLDGTKFDSSVDRGQPFTFTVGAGEVIAGWDQGLLNMKVGEKRQLTIPAELGYGNRGVGSIPANSTLVFTTELMAIE